VSWAPAARPPAPDPKSIVASVLKAVRLLECFSGTTPVLTLAALAEGTGMNKTTTHRLLASLELAGWVERGSAGTYRLTLKVFELGSAVLANIDLREEAAPEMSDLAAAYGETVYLVVTEEAHGVCIDRVEGRQQIRVMVLDVGRTMPLHMGAGPLVLLAEREEELLPRVLDVWLKDPSLAGSERALRETLAETRARGYSISLEDVTPGVAAIGTVIRDSQGQAVAALSLGGLVTRFGPERIEEMSVGLQAAAARVSSRLGYRELEARP